MNRYGYDESDLDDVRAEAHAESSAARARRALSCSDGFCGATDCERCYPGASNARHGPDCERCYPGASNARHDPDEDDDESPEPEEKDDEPVRCESCAACCAYHAARSAFWTALLAHKDDDVLDPLRAEMRRTDESLCEKP